MPEQKGALSSIVEQKAWIGEPQPAHLNGQTAKVSHVCIHGFPTSDRQHDEPEDYQTVGPAQPGEKGEAVHRVYGQENLWMSPDQDRPTHAYADKPQHHAPAKPESHPGRPCALHSEECQDNTRSNPDNVGLELLRHVLQTFNG